MASVKFKDQLDAANKLIEILPKKELNDAKTIVLCMSLESVILTDVVCKWLNLSYEMLFSEPIPAPNNSECDVAIVSETEDIVLNDPLIKAFNIIFIHSKTLYTSIKTLKLYLEFTFYLKH